MTCIVLVRNPSGRGILAIEDEDGNIDQFPDADSAKHATEAQTLVRAWGGYVVDLENMEVTEV